MRGILELTKEVDEMVQCSHLSQGLRHAWANVLNVEPSDIDDDSNFFEMGADSVAVIRLINRASNFGFTIEASQVFGTPLFKDMLRACVPYSQPTTCNDLTNGNVTFTDDEAFRRSLSKAAGCCGIDVKEIVELLPCTAVQRDFMQSHLDDGLYLFQATFRLDGPLESFCRAWNHIIYHNPIFRTRFVRLDEKWYQVVVEEEPQWRLEFDLAKYKTKDRAKGMKLGRPLSRQALVFEGGQVWFVWTVLHAVQDGWTRRLMHRDLTDCVNDPNDFLARPIRPTFGHYTRFLESIGRDHAMGYWHHLLDGLERFDMLYPPAWDKSQIALTRISKVATLPKLEGSYVGQAALAHAAWSIVLSIASGSLDVFFAADRSGRSCALTQVDDIMGAMLATVPFRVKLDLEAPLEEFLKSVAEQIVASTPYEAWGREAMMEHFGNNKCLQSNLLPQLTDADFLYDTVSGEFEGCKLTLTPTEQLITPAEVGLLLSSYPKGENQQFLMAKFDEDLIPYDKMVHLLDMYADAMCMLAQNAQSAEPLEKYRDSLSSRHSTIPGASEEHIPSNGVINANVTTLADLLEPRDDSTALIVPDRDSLSISRSVLQSLSDLAQGELARLGVQHGTTMCLSMLNNLEFVVSFVAITSMGCIAAPLNPALRQDEIDYYLGSMEPLLLIVSRESYPNKRDALQAARGRNIMVVEIFSNGTGVELAVVEGSSHSQAGTPAGQFRPLPDNNALVLYTSGTTGKPKAVPLTHQNLIYGSNTVRETYNLTKADRSLLIMPLFHIHGIVAGMLAPLISGCTLVVSSSVRPNFWQLATRNRVTWFTGTPTMHKMILQLPKPEKRPNLRFVRSCSSPLSPTTVPELEKLYGCPVLEAYAMTEAAHQMTSNAMQTDDRTRGGVGKPTRIELRIAKEDGSDMPPGQAGEICVRGASVMKGYIDNPEANKRAFTSDGYLRTGDQGVQSPDGSIQITGRMKELINKGGEKISPIEIDNELSKHDAVSDAVSFAVPDDMYGETVGVAIVPRQDRHVSETELKKWMLGRVAAHKVPSKFYFPESIPKTATGKVQRLEVARQMLAAGKAS